MVLCRIGHVVTSSTNTRVLHVANGSCTTRLIEAAGIPGAQSIWADPLHEGPVPGGLDDAQLVEVRARYLDGLTEPTTYVRPPASDAGADDVNDLKDRSTVTWR